MMKKNYMKPSMVAVKINEQILSGSGVGTGTQGNGGDALGKRHNRGSFADFDFEEEDEE